MRFYVCRTSIGESLFDYGGVLDKYRPDYRTSYIGSEYALVELDMNQLIDFVNELKEEVIIRPTDEDGDTVLEIYDDYRE